MNKKSLGRGLSSLLSDTQIDLNNDQDVNFVEEPNNIKRSKTLSLIPIEKIQPNINQPRKTFSEEELTELKNSIESKGLLQPIIVREKGGYYEIVAGERRWRAAQLAQLHEIPALIKELTDIEVLEIAIIENIQRSNLNPYEEALGYKQLLEKFNYTQEELASNLGKSRVYITNLTRLLNLPDSVLKFLKDGTLTAGHARALIGVDKALEIAKSIVKNELSVRETERLVKEFSKKNLKSKSTLKEKDADTEMLESELSAELGFPVSISHNEGEKRGRLVFNYRNLEDLDRVINIILKKTSD
ncbi:MAG: chromosome partitioning protein ParB [Rhodobacteraceae bacterium]|nr:MAG: chromosome partitioning protein ParB [Paracoccaceae bacterium]